MLTIAYRNASRREKLRNEIAQEKRENEAFVRNLERSKMIQNIQKKRAEKGEVKEEDTRARRHFKQNSVVTGQKPERSSILSKVFE